MQIEHTISEPYSPHIQEVLGQMSQADARILQLKGQILDLQHEREAMRRHLSVLVGLIARQDGLPDGMRLSADGTKLVGEKEGK